MAALRHAARRLCDCERALQRSHRVSPGRLPMSTSSSIKGKPDPTIDTIEALKLVEKRKQECQEFLERIKRKRPGTIIVTNMFRKPRHPENGTAARISLFIPIPFFLVSLYHQNNADESLKEQNDDMN